MQELLEKRARIAAELEAARIAAELEELRNRKTTFQKIQLFFAPCTSALSSVAAAAKDATEKKVVDGTYHKHTLFAYLADHIV